MLGINARERERQIIEDFALVKDWTYTEFTAETVVDYLFDDERGKPTEQIYEAYRVACRDLKRQGLLKRCGNPKKEVYVMVPEAAHYKENHGKN